MIEQLVCLKINNLTYCLLEKMVSSNLSHSEQSMCRAGETLVGAPDSCHCAAVAVFVPCFSECSQTAVLCPDQVLVSNISICFFFHLLSGLLHVNPLFLRTLVMLVGFISFCSAKQSKRCFLSALELRGPQRIVKFGKNTNHHHIKACVCVCACRCFTSQLYSCHFLTRRKGNILSLLLFDKIYKKQVGLFCEVSSGKRFYNANQISNPNLQMEVTLNRSICQSIIKQQVEVF